jgi:hypothetical protein
VAGGRRRAPAAASRWAGGDRYAWNFAYQWIDITGLPSGTYILRSAVDLFALFVESSETNNCSYVRLSISGSSLRVLGSGTSCVTDYGGTPFAADAAWALGAGLRAGCDPLLFCTYNPTLRDELAVFMSGLLELPPADEDLFDDDDGTRFEAYNNRVGAAGLITGCGVRRFCPSVKVSRALAAVTVYRALQLPIGKTDHFTDDAGLGAEPAIDAVADAGLMGPCGVGLFCPRATVLRGQMAQILRAAFEPSG